MAEYGWLRDESRWLLSSSLQLVSEWVVLLVLCRQRVGHEP